MEPSILRRQLQEKQGYEAKLPSKTMEKNNRLPFSKVEPSLQLKDAGVEPSASPRIQDTWQTSRSYRCEKSDWTGFRFSKLLLSFFRVPYGAQLTANMRGEALKKQKCISVPLTWDSKNTLDGWYAKAVFAAQCVSGNWKEQKCRTPYIPTYCAIKTMVFCKMHQKPIKVVALKL